ncbi:MAG: 1-acyl-sn-glycerol-3-phosphate acyltransferase, partial [Candidatus Cloacimonadaceae bacterium]
MKSLIWKIWFILFMLLCLVAYFPIILLKLVLPLKHYRRLIRFCVVVWARLTLLSTGSKVEIEGLELLPDATSICFIGNHQGLFDIPLVLG